MAIHSSILAWRIPWTEDPGGQPSMGSQRVVCNGVTNFGFGKCLGASSWSNHWSRYKKKLVVTGCDTKPTFHHTLQSDREMVYCCFVE